MSKIEENLVVKLVDEHAENFVIMIDQFKTINQTLESIHKALSNNKEMNDETWKSVDDVLPDERYDWVFVKIQMTNKNGLPTGSVFSVPHISHFDPDARLWITQDSCLYYNTDEYPYKVVLWKPIPGDQIIETVDGCGKVIGRHHIYE